MSAPGYASRIDQTTLRNVIAAHTDSVLIEQPWQCNVIRAHALLIEQHITSLRQQGRDVELKFSSIDRTPQFLRDLLWEDFAYLARGTPVLRDFADRCVLAEVSGPYPNSTILNGQDEHGQALAIVCFKSQLLQYIHSGFSKLWVLTSDAIDAGCLPEHDAILESPAYSDTSLLAGLFNDIEVLFDQKRLFLPFDPPHMADPFEYCERVEGIRRFLLAHELGHALVKPMPLPESELAGLSRSQRAAVERQDEEFGCDAFATYAILDCYATDELEGPALYELENALVGIMTFFFLMEVSETLLRWRRALPDSHPPHRRRLACFRWGVRRHPLYKRSDALRQTLDRNWRRLNSFRNFCGGANAPMALGKVWNRFELLEKLTPFGREAYRALFDETVWEWSELDGGDARSFNHEQANF